MKKLVPILVLLVCTMVACLYIVKGRSEEPDTTPDHRGLLAIRDEGKPHEGPQVTVGGLETSEEACGNGSSNVL